MTEVVRAQRPFWIHQLVEYLIGIVLISIGIQSPEPAVPAVLGLVVIANAAIARGGAGAFRLVGPRTHKAMDVVVMLALVALAVQPWISVDVTNRLVLGAIAFVLFFVWFHTDFDTRVERKARRADRARAGSEDVGRTAGRVVGGGLKAVREQWRSFTADDEDGPGSSGGSSGRAS